MTEHASRYFQFTRNLRAPGPSKHCIGDRMGPRPGGDQAEAQPLHREAYSLSLIRWSIKIENPRGANNTGLWVIAEAANG